MVRFENVGMRYGSGPEVLRDVSFSLEPGSFTFLTGLSGAGKTTLLKLIYVAEPPSRGLITLFGTELATARRRDLPAGVDYWDFDCRFGLGQDSAETVHLSQLIGKVDEAAQSDATQVYVEILAKHGVRGGRVAPQGGDEI